MKQDSVLQEISLYDLGEDTSSMLASWQELKQKKIPVSLKEYPDVDCYQKIGNQDVIELAIEICQNIEKRRKEVAKEKQAHGIQQARIRGVQLGRRPLEVPKNFLAIYQQITKKEINLTQATKILRVDYRTLKKWIQEMENK